MRPIIFVNSITTTMSNEKKIKIKVVDLQRLNNIVVEIFFKFEIIFSTESVFELLKFEIQIL